MAQKKKRLTKEQEFEIMKLVLDKFLWLGFGIMAFGVVYSVAVNFFQGFSYIIVGAILLLLFTWIITKEYEVIA